jgi:phosphocarrier protein
MAAKVPQGSRLHFRAAGHDAGDAIAALIGLVERDFDEAQADAANG